MIPTLVPAGWNRHRAFVGRPDMPLPDDPEGAQACVGLWGIRKPHLQCHPQDRSLLCE
jgi:hypothetical protein